MPVLIVLLIMPVTVNAATGKIVKESEDMFPVGGFEPAEIRYITEDVDVENASDLPKKRRNIINSDGDSIFIKGASTV